MKQIFVLLPVLVLIILWIFVTPKYEMSEKVDKGVELCYWKLSHRRKMIRTLWMIPLAIAAIILFHKTFQSYFWTFVVIIIVSGLFLGQILYHYKKWKREVD